MVKNWFGLPSCPTKTEHSGFPLAIFFCLFRANQGSMETTSPALLKNRTTRALKILPRWGLNQHPHQSPNHMLLLLAKSSSSYIENFPENIFVHHHHFISFEYNYNWKSYFWMRSCEEASLIDLLTLNSSSAPATFHLTYYFFCCNQWNDTYLIKIYELPV